MRASRFAASVSKRSWTFFHLKSHSNNLNRSPGIHIFWGERFKNNSSFSTSTEGSKRPNPDTVESLSITPRDKDYSQWYLDIIAAAQMAENSPVKGCMIIRPWGMAIWDAVRDQLNSRIKATGAENAYFPLFIPLSFISKVWNQEIRTKLEIQWNARYCRCNVGGRQTASVTVQKRQSDKCRP
jgi:hypothetical protein